MVLQKILSYVKNAKDKEYIAKIEKYYYYIHNHTYHFLKR